MPERWARRLPVVSRTNEDVRDTFDLLTNYHYSNAMSKPQVLFATEDPLFKERIKYVNTHLNRQPEAPRGVSEAGEAVPADGILLYQTALCIEQSHQGG